MTEQTARPVVAVLIPAAIREYVLSAAARERLDTLAAVRYPAGDDLSPDALPDLLAGATACLTGWQTPPLPDALLAATPSLGLVAHTAGTIHRLVPPAAMGRGLRVTHAAAIIADAVAEFTVAQMLLAVRKLHLVNQAMRAGEPWREVSQRFMQGGLLGERAVGVVGAGRVGRAVIRLLRAFGCRVLVYDPLLTPDDAAAMGVEATALNDLIEQSDIVSLHAPVLPETKGMIGRAQLAGLREGAIFVNTARAALVDEDALFEELSSGRITAVLDVFGQEPLPPDSPFRDLPGVILSPHLAGRTRDTHLRQGAAMVEEIARFLRGESLQYEITSAMLPFLA